MRISAGNRIPHTPGSDLVAGSIVTFSQLIGIADAAIAAGELGALSISGVYDLPRIGSLLTALPAGSPLYWHISAEEVRTTPSGAFFIGYSIELSPKFATRILTLLRQ